MYQRTYDRIINLFSAHLGYMSYENLKSEGITVLQMRELEDEGVLERFARGWYWCNKCGYNKPSDYKYIEVGLVDPEAVICLDSACYLGGVRITEPSTVKFAVPRGDRKKLKFDFATERYFYTHMEEKYIATKHTEFGSYRFFAPARAAYDSIKNIKKLDELSVEGIKLYCKTHAGRLEEYKKFIKSVKQSERNRNKERLENG